MLKARLFILILFTESLILLPFPIWACSIPVYQYALENWSADPYEAFVFYDRKLSSNEQYKLDKLNKTAQNSKLNANITIKNIDLSDPSNIDIQKSWKLHDKSSPYIIIKYPRFSRIPDSVWEGKISVLDVENIINSPARKEIIKRIINGEVAVWVLLESGNKQKDNIALDTLEKQLKKMSETLKIIGDPLLQTDESQKDAKFSLIKLSRGNQRENFFIQMLLKSEPDLKTLSEPMAFPIFGRGRLLYSLVGEGINADNIESACSFLIGWCSCEIKDMNPGVDILMAINWDKVLKSKLYEETKIDEGEVGAIKSDSLDESKNKEKISDLPMQKNQSPISKAKRNEINKQIQRIGSNSENINLAIINDEPNHLIRNIFIAILTIILGITVAVSFILLRKRQKI